MLIVVIAACHLADSQATTDSPRNLSPAPPMGWASWNHYFCDYTDQTIRDQADALVSSGMRELGYRYVLIQECIAPRREANGDMMVDAKRFPHGMKDLVDYIHLRGLKAGIYTDIGTHTCFKNPLYEGSYQHEEHDANTFAAWGIDIIEMDYCNRPAGIPGRAVYERMAAAIQKTGRPMLFYICSWGNESPWTWAQGKAQLWRTDTDISWNKNQVEWTRVVQNFESNARHSVFSAPNSWNDPDMLEIGNPGLTATEEQTHFLMWAISAAPLWVSNDLTKMSDSIRRIYTNVEVVAVNQDSLGAGPMKVREYDNGLEVWRKHLGSVGSGVDAVLLLNLRETPTDIRVHWDDLGIVGKAAVRDLIAHKDLGEFPDGYQAKIPAHGSMLLKVSGEFSWIKGATYEAEWPGNIRAGDTTLLVCPECSQSYAISLQGPKHEANDSVKSSLIFTHVCVLKAGRYSATIFYVYSGPRGKKTMQMQVNGSSPTDVQLPEFVYSSIKVPVDLNKGDNTIAFQFAGEGRVNIDRILLSQDSPVAP